MARFSLTSHKTRIVWQTFAPAFALLSDPKKGEESGACACASPTPFNIRNCLPLFTKGMNINASGVHSNAMPFNFLQSIITAWRTLESVRRKRATEAYLFVKPYRNRPWKRVWFFVQFAIFVCSLQFPMHQYSDFVILFRIN